MKYLYAGLQMIGFVIFVGVAVIFWTICKNVAENRTKKVCDMCFRDIKRWNEETKKLKNKVNNYKI